MFPTPEIAVRTNQSHDSIMLFIEAFKKEVDYFADELHTERAIALKSITESHLVNQGVSTPWLCEVYNVSEYMYDVLFASTLPVVKWSTTYCLGMTSMMWAIANLVRAHEQWTFCKGLAGGDEAAQSLLNAVEMKLRLSVVEYVNG